MITNTLTVVLTVLLLAFGISMVPDAGPLPPQIASALSTTVNYVVPWGYFIDYSVLFKVIGIVMSTELVILAYRLIMKIIHYVRGVATH